LLLFLEKEGYYETNSSLGARPQTPWVGFAEVRAKKPSAKQNKRFLLLFLEKEGYYETNSSLGARPQTPWVGFAEVRANKPSAKQNKRFLLLFLEKEEYWKTNSFLDAVAGFSGASIGVWVWFSVWLIGI
jgi:hypothetical protein